MGISDTFTTKLREIQADRRRREQAFARESADHQRHRDEIGQRLGNLDRELEDELARIRQEFQERGDRLREERLIAEREVERIEGEAEKARLEEKDAICGELRGAARESASIVHHRHAELERQRESRTRREAILGQRPDLAKKFAEYQGIRKFHDGLEASAGLPTGVLAALRSTLEQQVIGYRRELETARVPLEGAAPAPDQVVIFYEVTDSGPKVAHLVTPCRFDEYEGPDLAAPSLALRVAGGMVRAVAEVQRALTSSNVPILYENMDGLLVVAGFLGETANATEAAQMLELEVPDSVNAILEASGSQLRTVMQAVPPGVMARLLVED